MNKLVDEDETGSRGRKPDQPDAQMAATVDALAAAVAADAIHPKAVVIMPSEEDLQVQLVRLDDVLRLQESVSDESLVAGVFFTLFGSLLGILVNLVTADVFAVTEPTLVAIAADVLFIGLTGFYWRRLRSRTTIRRSKLRIGPMTSAEGLRDL